MAQYAITYPTSIDTFSTDSDYINHVIALQNAMTQLELQIGIMNTYSVTWVSNAATVTPNVGLGAIFNYTMTNNAVASTLTIAAPTGTATNGRQILLFLDNTNNPYNVTVTWTNTAGSGFFKSNATALPSVTASLATMVGFMFFSAYGWLETFRGTSFTA
jgi:hypothetical protein